MVKNISNIGFGCVNVMFLLVHTVCPLGVQLVLLFCPMQTSLDLTNKFMLGYIVSCLKDLPMIYSSADCDLLIQCFNPCFVGSVVAVGTMLPILRQHVVIHAQHGKSKETSSVIG